MNAKAFIEQRDIERSRARVKWTDTHRDHLARIYGRLLRRFGTETVLRHMEHGRLIPAAHKRVEQ